MHNRLHYSSGMNLSSQSNDSSQDSRSGSVIASSAPSETGFRVRKILFRKLFKPISFCQLELSYEENFGDEQRQ